jgi:hypothetical protein
MSNRTSAMTNRISAILKPYLGYRETCQAVELMQTVLTYPQGGQRLKLFKTIKTSKTPAADFFFFCF